MGKVIDILQSDDTFTEETQTDAYSRQLDARKRYYESHKEERRAYAREYKRTHKKDDSEYQLRYRMTKDRTEYFKEYYQKQKDRKKVEQSRKIPGEIK